MRIHLRIHLRIPLRTPLRTNMNTPKSTSLSSSLRHQNSSLLPVLPQSIYSMTLLIISLMMLNACGGDQARLRDRQEFEKLIPTLKQGDQKAKQVLEHYLLTYRQRAIGNPFAEIEDSPHAQEAREIYESSAHILKRYRLWHQAWNTLWTRGSQKGLKAFLSLQKELKSATRPTLYAEEVKEVIEDLQNQSTPSQWSPKGVRWMGVSTLSTDAQSSKGLCTSLNEITVKQYTRCVEAGRCSEPDQGGSCLWGKAGYSSYPINCVSWHQAQEYSKWVGGRLPTKREWIWIARSAEKSWSYPWGDEDLRCVHGVLSGNEQSCSKGLSPVCRKPEGLSLHGVCDLVGNVREWLHCEDDECRRSIRGHIGESWRTVVYHAQYRRVEEVDPNYRYYDLGFRPIRECIDHPLPPHPLTHPHEQP